MQGEYENAAEIATGFGRRGVSAENVAHQAEEGWRRYLRAAAPVGEHLADQLLVPLALAGEGRFRTLAPSPHTRTNAETIAAFLPARFDFHKRATNDWEIALSKGRT